MRAWVLPSCAAPSEYCAVLRKKICSILRIRELKSDGNQAHQMHRLASLPTPCRIKPALRLEPRVWTNAAARADARLAEQAIFNFENSSRTKFANQLQTRTDVNDCSTRKLSLAQLSKRAARICDRWK